MDITTRWVDAPGDGKSMPVYVAEPSEASKFPALVYFHIGLGLNEQHQAMVRRLASMGFVVAAPELFYRLGPHLIFEPTPDREARDLAMASLSDWGLIGDARTALNLLKENPRVDGMRIGTIGFCIGGRISILAASVHSDIRATVAAYATELRHTGHPLARPIDVSELVGGLNGPLLHLSGEHDSLCTPDIVKYLATVMRDHNKPFEYEIYSDCGHAFFDEDIPQRPGYFGFHEASCTAGWERSVQFLTAHLK